MMGVRLVLGVAIAGVLAAGTGCSSNPWEKNYTPNPAFRGIEFEPTAGVTIRRVEADRLEAYHEAAHARATVRDLPVDEWPEAWQVEEKIEFLRTIRVMEGPREVFYLGAASFPVPGGIDPYDGRLEAFAMELGADYAVVSDQYIGVRDKIVYAPVTSTGVGVGYGSRRAGRWGTDVWYGTTHVPTVVGVDTFHYVAYFLRTTSEEEFALVRGRTWGD